MQGPRLYRFFNYEQITYAPAPTGGWNPDANPWLLPANQAHVLDNFLIRPGKITMRGPFQVGADLSAHAPLNLAGYVVTGASLLSTRASGTVDPWNSPLTGTSSGVLASAATTMYWVVQATGAITPITVTVDQAIGPRWINFDGLLYGISYDSTGSVAQDTNHLYYVKPTNLLTLQTTPPQSQTSGPIFPNVYSSITYGGHTWAPAVGISASDATLPSKFDYTDYLTGSSYGFTIPTGATINGIQVWVKKSAQQSSGLDPTVDDQSVKMMKAGAVVGTDHRSGFDWPQYPTFGSTYYGSATDLWGTTWTPTDINNSGFGAAISAGNFGVVSQTAYVQLIAITVYYTIGGSTPSPNVLSAAPHGAFDLKGYQSRIWLLGGIDTPGSGTTHSPNTIFFTNPIASGGGSASSDWKDPVSGLTNKITMDNDNADYGVGLGIVRNGLIIFRRSSVWLLKGTTTANYTLIPISREVGCSDARSIVETDTGVYFMSQKGLMLTDGVKVVNMSGSVMYTLQQAVATEQAGVISGAGGYISCGLTSQGQILVSIGTNGTNGHISPIWCALYDPAAAKGGAWTRITSQLWTADGTQTGTNYYPGQILQALTPKQLFVVGDKYLTVLEDWTQGNSFLVTTGLYDQAPSSQFYSIPATWKTKFYNSAISATLRRRAIGKRFFLDYAFAGNGIVPTTGWTLVPVDANDAQVSGSEVMSAILGMPPATNGSVSGLIPVAPNIQRQNLDFTNEFADLGFDLSWSDPTVQSAQATSVAADVYGLGVEWQKSSDLR